MTYSASIRSLALLTALTSAAVCVCVCLPAAAQTYNRRPAPATGAAPIERRPPSPPAASAATPHDNSGAQKGLNGEHLGGWLNRHSNLTPTQKLQALEREPGFHDLPAQTQQRMRDRLLQLNNMSPQKRERLLSGTEAMERLTPNQRLQVRNAMDEFAALPPASHHAVSRTFRIVRGMPPAQRLAYLNSPEVRSQFTEQERDTLTHLMAVEPFLPVHTPPPAQGPH